MIQDGKALYSQNELISKNFPKLFKGIVDDYRIMFF